MKNKLDEIIDERLLNRNEWKNYLDWLITHRNLSLTAKKAFYQDKPLLNMILGFYFLPLNTYKKIIFLIDIYKYQKICKEIEILQTIKESNNKNIIINEKK